MCASSNDLCTSRSKRIGSAAFISLPPRSTSAERPSKLLPFFATLLSTFSGGDVSVSTDKSVVFHHDSGVASRNAMLCPPCAATPKKTTGTAQVNKEIGDQLRPNTVNRRPGIRAGHCRKRAILLGEDPLRNFHGEDRAGSDENSRNDTYKQRRATAFQRNAWPDVQTTIAIIQSCRTACTSLPKRTARLDRAARSVSGPRPRIRKTSLRRLPARARERRLRRRCRCSARPRLKSACRRERN